MLDIYYLAALIGGLALLLAWLEHGQRGLWLAAGLALLLAGTFHVQGWLPLGLILLLHLPELIRLARQQKWERAGRLLAIYALAALLPLTLFLAGWVANGRPLSFLGEHTRYSLWFYGGYNVSDLEKLLYYPRLVWVNSHPLLWLLAAVGVGLLWRARAGRRVWLLPAIGLLTLLALSVLNLNSGPPSAAPGRYSLLYTATAALYAGYGGSRLLVRGLARRSSAGYAVVGLTAVLLAWLLIAGYRQAWQFPRATYGQAVAAGEALRPLLDAPDFAPGDRYLLEVVYWDFLAAQLAAGHHEAALFDRPFDLYNRDQPSVLILPPEALARELVAQRVRYALLRDPALKEQAAASGLLTAVIEVEGWTLYQVTITKSEGGKYEKNSSAGTRFPVSRAPRQCDLSSICSRPWVGTAGKKLTSCRPVAQEVKTMVGAATKEPWLSL
ncbi:MAG: hypothetical protein L0322_28670 [Chloroflexi bacterium]|nr:hypothetical protein [Chloroflexota bacterium]